MAILTIQPTLNLKPINLENFGNLAQVGGVSVCTFLANQKVAERQAQTATETLARKGYSAKIQIVNDTSNPIQKGSSIVLWAKTDTGVILGADAIGELRKTSEAVGKEAAEKLSTELVTSPTVDVHLSDMLIPFMALTRESSVYLARVVSDHLETNIWLAEKMLNARFKIEKVGALYRVEKLAQ
jgi:RNA 3'-terminal phosphate cyclase (ATP)